MLTLLSILFFSCSDKEDDTSASVDSASEESADTSEEEDEDTAIEE